MSELTIQQLAEHATQAIRSAAGIISDPTVTIAMPGTWGRNNYRYLAGQKSPKGQIVQAYVGQIIVQFSAIDILAWCQANGANITIVRLSDGDESR